MNPTQKQDERGGGKTWQNSYCYYVRTACVRSRSPKKVAPFRAHKNLYVRIPHIVNYLGNNTLFTLPQEINCGKKCERETRRRFHVRTT